MKQRTRIYYTEAQKAGMWDHWEKGESLHSIARLFDLGHSSVEGILAETGALLRRKVEVLQHLQLVTSLRRAGQEALDHLTFFGV